MQCEFTALVVPERNLVVVSKAEGREVDTSVLAKMHRHLLSLAQVRSEASLLNAADSLPGVTLPFRVLSSPIRNPAGRPAACWRCSARREAPEFRRRDAHAGRPAGAPRRQHHRIQLRHACLAC